MSLNVDDDPSAFPPSEIDIVAPEMVSGELRTFHDNLATLLVTLYLGTRLVVE